MTHNILLDETEKVTQGETHDFDPQSFIFKRANNQKAQM